MNKEYFAPELSIDFFEAKDIITLSFHASTLSVYSTSGTQDSPIPVIDADELEYK